MKNISKRSVVKFCLICYFITIAGALQSQTITKYYNSDWEETIKEKATYLATFVKQGNAYIGTSYWVASNTIRGRSTYPDTSFLNPIGVQTLYYKNGRLEDSIHYKDGKASSHHHFYPNKQLALHYYLPTNAKEPIISGYDEDGKKIKNFIYERDAEFKGGVNGWVKYLEKNMSKEIDIKGKGEINADVHIKFIIDEEGNVSSVKVHKSSGYKEIDNDAVRVISESPAWRNAILYNNPVKVYRLQPIKYKLLDQKR